MKTIGAMRIQRDDYGELWEGQLPDSEGPSRWCRVVCPSTGRVYYNCVPREMRTCRQGLAWRWGLEEEQYAPISEG